MANHFSIIRGLTTLRWCSWMRDADKVSSKQINYFVDADVVSLFLSPSTTSHLLGIFSGDTEELDALIPASYETAEYIFSGNLPQQVNKSLYLSNGHLEDVNRILDAVSIKASGLIATRPTPHLKVKTMMESLRTETLAAGEDGFDSKEIRQLITRLAMYVKAQMAPQNEAILSINRLHKKKMVKGASSWERYREISKAIPTSAIDEWCARIACARDFEKFSNVIVGLEKYNRYSFRVKRNIEADARTLAEVIQLNEDSDTQCSVLITATNTLHRAYVEWFLEHRHISSQFQLRHPIQYLPLVSFEEYGQKYNFTKDVKPISKRFSDIDVSLDFILDPSNVMPRKNDVLQYFQLSEYARKKNNDDAANNMLRKLEWVDNQNGVDLLIKKWRLAYSNAAMMGIPALFERSSEHREIWISAIDNVKGDIVKAHENILANIHIDNLSLALQSWANVYESERANLPPDMLPRESTRALLPTLLDTTLALGAQTPKNAFKNSITRVVRQIPKVSKLIDAANPIITRLFAGVCVSMGLGNWVHAKRLAKWGSEISVDKWQINPKMRNRGWNAHVISPEFIYLFAICVRFECESSEQFKSVDISLKNIHDEAINKNNKCTLRAARAITERGSLYLIAALRALSISHLGQSETWPKFREESDLGETKELLRRAITFLQKGSTELSQIPPPTNSIAKQSKNIIALQNDTNLLSAYILCEIDGHRIDSAMEYHCEKSYARLTNQNLSQEPSVVRLNIRAYQAFKRGIQVEDLNSAKELSTLYQRLAKYPATRRTIAGSDLDLVKLCTNHISKNIKVAK